MDVDRIQAGTETFLSAFESFVVDPTMRRIVACVDACDSSTGGDKTKCLSRCEVAMDVAETSLRREAARAHEDLMRCAVPCDAKQDVLENAAKDGTMGEQEYAALDAEAEACYLECFEEAVRGVTDMRKRVDKDMEEAKRS